MLDSFISYIKGKVVPILLALIVAMILLGILHKYFPNNFLGQAAEDVKQWVTGSAEGL